MSNAAMSQKVARLSKGNKLLEETNGTLLREIAELSEEQEIMTASIRSQVEEHERIIAEENAQAEAAARASNTDAIDDEVAQLVDELARAHQAAQRRRRQNDAEITALRAELERREQQLLRTERASSMMNAAAAQDCDELARLRLEERDLEDEVDDLEAQCIKAHCQTAAWDAIVQEAKHKDAIAVTDSSACKCELQTNADGLKVAITNFRMEMGNLIALCTQLQADLDSQQPGGKELQASGNLRTSIEVRERGVQTRYLSEQSALYSQVAKLTEELDCLRCQAAVSAPAAASTSGGGLARWFDFCLRQGNELADAATGPEPAAVTRSLRV